MVARIERAQDGIFGSKPARERKTMARAFQRGDLGLQHGTRRVRASRVLVPAVLAYGVLRERGRETDRRHHRAGTGVGILPGVNGPRLEPVAVHAPSTSSG